MFQRNGQKPGFWIQRDTWLNWCARILRVGQGTLTGYPPYFGSPVIKADFYNIHTGELQMANTKVRSPGTYSYVRIARPKWFKQTAEEKRQEQKLMKKKNRPTIIMVK